MAVTVVRGLPAGPAVVAVPVGCSPAVVAMVVPVVRRRHPSVPVVTVEWAATPGWCRCSVVVAVAVQAGPVGLMLARVVLVVPVAVLGCWR